MNKIELKNGLKMLGLGFRRIPDHRPGAMPRKRHEKRRGLSCIKGMDPGYEKTKQSFKKPLDNLQTDIEGIRDMDCGKSLILDASSLDEVYRLHDTCFEQ